MCLSSDRTTEHSGKNKSKYLRENGSFSYHRTFLLFIDNRCATKMALLWQKQEQRTGFLGVTRTAPLVLHLCPLSSTLLFHCHLLFHFQALGHKQGFSFIRAYFLSFSCKATIVIGTSGVCVNIYTKKNALIKSF